MTFPSGTRLGLYEILEPKVRDKHSPHIPVISIDENRAMLFEEVSANA